MSQDALDSMATPIFNGALAQRGLALNKLCFSFNFAANREAFLRDEAGYSAQYGLSDQQFAAVRSRSVLALLEAGGNIYYLAKLAGVFGWNMQDIGAQQSGMSLEAFKAQLSDAGK